MRQVGEAELIYRIATALGRVRATVWKQLADHRPQIRDQAMVHVASRAAGALAQLEVLTDAPAASDSTFTQPLARMAGEDIGSGAPEITQPWRR